MEKRRLPKLCERKVPLLLSRNLLLTWNGGSALEYLSNVCELNESENLDIAVVGYPFCVQNTLRCLSKVIRLHFANEEMMRHMWVSGRHSSFVAAFCSLNTKGPKTGGWQCCVPSCLWKVLGWRSECLVQKYQSHGHYGFNRVANLEFCVTVSSYIPLLIRFFT